MFRASACAFFGRNATRILTGVNVTAQAGFQTHLRMKHQERDLKQSQPNPQHVSSSFFNVPSIQAAKNEEPSQEFSKNLGLPSPNT